MNGQPVRVLIADDDALMRAGLRAVLSSDQQIEVVGEASSGRGAISQARAHRPDVVLMDVRMPDLDGIAATRELLAASPEVKVVIVTTFQQDDYIFGALNAGASGFLLKRTRPEELIAAIHTVAAGDSLLSPSVTRIVIDHIASQPPPSTDSNEQLEELTPREREVLGLIATRPHERRDRHHARDRGIDRQDSHQTDPDEARTARPHPRRDLRLPNRPRPARRATSPLTGGAGDTTALAG